MSNNFKEHQGTISDTAGMQIEKLSFGHLHAGPATPAGIFLLYEGKIIGLLSEAQVKQVKLICNKIKSED